uniref:GCVT N-terminal domain-containing protein n=1 Tax=Amphimedon queenslandica TaxID=400682 RepID=A0A1X7SDL8_AMPQE
LREFGDDKVVLTSLNERALVALQGPKSASVLQEGVKGDLSQLKFMSSALMSLFGIPDCRVSRCGYTGEDGFEISIPSTDVIRLVDTLLAADPVKLAGLGARDVLRLEAGLCLYGNDISEDTTPIEASLAWCIDKTRRKDGNFLGAGPILQQLKDKPFKRRVGLELKSGPPAR